VPRVTYIQPNGESKTVDVPAGTTAMEAAIDNDVAGIVAECGGAASCATCHVYVDSEWFKRLPAPSQMESDMLDFASDVQPTSRLSCQIVMTAELDGLIVKTPERQG